MLRLDFWLKAFRRRKNLKTANDALKLRAFARSLGEMCGIFLRVRRLFAHAWALSQEAL